MIASAPVYSNAQRTCSASRMPPDTITGTGSVCTSSAARSSSGRALVAHLDRARVERDAGHAGLLRRPAEASVEDLGRRSLTVTGRPEPSAAARATATAVSGSLSRAAPAPVLQDLRDGAAHVEVDQVGARLGHRAAAARVTSGSWPRSCIATGPASRSRGSMTEQLVERAAGSRRGSRSSRPSRDREPGPVALGLQAHEPVADARQRREHDAVGDPDAPSFHGSVSGRTASGYGGVWRTTS